MLAYTSKKLRHLLRLEFVRFCIVGGFGFVLNLIILSFLHRILKLPVFIAQLIGAEIALFSNFMLHHHWTYESHHVEKTIRRLVIEFHITSWPAIFGSALMVSLGERFLHLNNVTALVCSSVLVFAWNYCWSKFVVWRHVTEKEIEEIAA